MHSPPRAFTSDDVHRSLSAFEQQFGLLLELAQRRMQRESGERRARDALAGTLFAMQRLVEASDPYTHGYEERVARLAVSIADELGFPPEQRAALEIAAELHDVGKVSIPSDILIKPSRLSTHGSAVVRQHHERLDGSSYPRGPRGPRGEQVMREARVLAVADVAESMLSHRQYRAAPGIDGLRRKLQIGRGKTYDADVVDACLAVLVRPDSPLAQRSTNARSNT